MKTNRDKIVTILLLILIISTLFLLLTFRGCNQVIEQKQPTIPTDTTTLQQLPDSTINAPQEIVKSVKTKPIEYHVVPTREHFITNLKDSIVIYFRLDKYDIDKSYLNNEVEFIRLDSLLNNTYLLSVLDSITLQTRSSIEGGVEYNQRLSAHRANTLAQYISATHPELSEKIKMSYVGEDWAELRRMVLADKTIPYKDEVLKVIDADINLETKEWRLRRVGGGVSWRYIEVNMLPYSRYGASLVFHFDREELAAIVTGKPVIKTESLLPELKFELPRTRKPLFAVKTNLLFDAMSLVNIEIEIPIRDRWSLAAEWIFPWWGNDTSDNAVQLLNGNLEAKYWLGDRAGCSVLTGWYAGVYTGGGLYDFRRDSKGYIGEFFIAAGVSGGYAHTINKSGNLRMEYSVGVGFLQTDYRYYIGEVNNMYWVRQYNGKYTWIGPTRVKVSLSWLLNSKKRVR